MKEQNSGSLRSRFPEGPSTKSGKKLTHIFRGGVNGRETTLYARTESKVQVARVNRTKEMVQEAREAFQSEKQKKLALQTALQNKPLGEKLKKDKCGYYYQPRINGRFQPKVRL